MRAARATVCRLGLVWTVSLFALAAPAVGLQGAQDIGPPDLPDATLSLEGLAPSAAQPIPAAAETPIDAPDLPAVVVAVPPAEPDSGVAALVVPDLPAAPVAITATDLIRAALAAQLSKDLGDRSLRLPRKEREALTAFYEQAGYKPLWVDADRWAPTAGAVIGRLKAADEDGLDPTDYPIPSVATTKATPEDWAEAEVKLSTMAVLYARDARGARVDPLRLSNLITPKLEIPGAADVMARLSGAPDAGAALASFNPPHAGYAALKAHLAELRASHPARPMVRVPQGPALRVGMHDPRVPLIRARFNLDPAQGDQTAYDERVATAVAEFQKTKGMPASGILNRQTIAALGGPSSARLEGDIVANMERWRWLPADMGTRHIAVNIPEFRLRIVDRGEAVHETRVIVGKPETPTPVFSDEMETVIVNPSWNVPPSILKNEFLPALASDPLYAERRGYKVIRRGDRISIQQPPGERNALGFIKFIFPNEHAVYLHDTPSRNLFSAERRAFSHGCVRVYQPFQLAEAVLGRDSPWSEPKLRSMIGKGERYISLRQKMPVHLTYFTLSVDENAQLKSFDDLYGFHRKVRAALGFDT
jgi:L,D-transpeptidase YcbB